MSHAENLLNNITDFYKRICIVLYTHTSELILLILIISKLEYIEIFSENAAQLIET